jgi:hypothetical protein
MNYNGNNNNTKIMFIYIYITLFINFTDVYKKWSVGNKLDVNVSREHLTNLA